MKDVFKYILPIFAVMFMLWFGMKLHAAFIRYECEQVIDKKVSRSAMKCLNEGC